MMMLLFYYRNTLTHDTLITLKFLAMPSTTDSNARQFL